ncbi:MAG: hypothetical protein LWX02_14080 [Deltaproteobacteria bacterium]|jgi:hypothetical protein|nr:hypothetical protein [Deltaproteobacteria bacterium]
MEEERKKAIALFKYGLIAPVLHGNVKVQIEYFKEAAKKKYEVPHIGLRKFKAATFKSWLKRYRKNGFFQSIAINIVSMLLCQRQERIRVSPER